MNKKRNLIIICVSVLIILLIGLLILRGNSSKTEENNNLNKNNNTKTKKNNDTNFTDEIFYGIKDFTEINIGNREWEGNDPYISQIGTIKIPSDANFSTGQGYNRNSKKPIVLEHHTPVSEFDKENSLEDLEIFYKMSEKIYFSMFINCTTDSSLSGMENTAKENNEKVISKDGYYYLLAKEGVKGVKDSNVLHLYIGTDLGKESNVSIRVDVQDGHGNLYQINNPEKLAESVYKLFNINK